MVVVEQRQTVRLGGGRDEQVDRAGRTMCSTLCHAPGTLWISSAIVPLVEQLVEHARLGHGDELVEGIESPPPLIELTKRRVDRFFRTGGVEM